MEPCTKILCFFKKMCMFENSDQVYDDDQIDKKKKQPSSEGGGGGAAAAAKKGFVPVHVGRERSRFLVRADVFSAESFKGFLAKYEVDEILDLSGNGCLTLPCTPMMFKAKVIGATAELAMDN